MTRRFSKATEFSLFPFLDALSGVIGILSLIISVMAIIGLQDSRFLEMQWTASHGLKPVFVECRKDGVVLHPEKESVNQAQMSIPNSAWQRTIHSVEANADKQFLVLLIRPDGIQTYQRARSDLDDRNIKLGKDVIDAHVNLDFK